MVFKQLVQRARQILSPKLMNVDQAVLDSHRTALLMKCFDWCVPARIKRHPSSPRLRYKLVSTCSLTQLLPGVLFSPFGMLF